MVNIIDVQDVPPVWIILPAIVSTKDGTLPVGSQLFVLLRFFTLCLINLSFFLVDTTFIYGSHQCFFLGYYSEKFTVFYVNKGLSVDFDILLAEHTI